VRIGAGILLAVALAACGGGGKQRAATPKPVEHRVVTAGAELLEHVPAGADAVLELDVARLRHNDAVGDTVRALSPWLKQRQAVSALPIDLPIDADLVVAAVYGLGTADAAMLVLVRGEAIDADAVATSAADTERVDEHTFAFAPPALRARLHERSLSDDAELLALRDEAMPERAPGASLRLTARLSGEARVATASLLGYDGALPATVSMWADVADDFALVAILGADSDAEAQHLAADVDALVKRAGRAFGIPLSLRRVKATPSQSVVRLVWTIGPKALEKLRE
jgi:hypothetical protein